jgi:hypothetical protein
MSSCSEARLFRSGILTKGGIDSALTNESTLGDKNGYYIGGNVAPNIRMMAVTVTAPSLFHSLDPHRSLFFSALAHHGPVKFTRLKPFCSQKAPVLFIVIGFPAGTRRTAGRHDIRRT